VTVEEIQAPSDLLSALERSGVDRARLAQVATLIELASSASGAGVGSVVRVADRVGRISEYELVEHPDAAARHQVTTASPIGRSLLGARPGDHVQLTFGNGRRRRVRVLDVAAAA
jgi:transcription elongation GreA/GreB family factor